MQDVGIIEGDYEYKILVVKKGPRVHLLSNKDILKKASKALQGFTRRKPSSQDAEDRLPPHVARGSSKDLEANRAADTDRGLARTTGDKTVHAGGEEIKSSPDGFEKFSLHEQEPPRAPSLSWRQACVDYTHRVLSVFDGHDYDPALSSHHDDIINEAEQEAAEALMTDPYAHLGRTGLLTALAIGIHNVPEGLATFIATLASVKAGGAMAVAIAIHNIPEGIAVSMPFYYATGSKFKALLFGTLAGFPLPCGGLIAYGIVVSSAGTSPLMFGLLFGLVAGMMVAVVFMEILPNAYLFDPRNVWVGRGVAFGFAIMAASLLLFGVGG
ncbi:ZIP zinc transporter-domain-containing protein [Dunaliella salina]|uniref:ZIP zinc transporter-domain-containing protein n=1 Tax=Dunaliella salina TaxID=3046 RepID=A0ABQ7G6C8_DUNSA|nr:ZIP zinc transporter-domain-containing protein [Dunaliella salina]|eukprot:KAF5830165.1 ZIP zinc transporter-domain-containing protein [Dunaliella salina]